MAYELAFFPPCAHRLWNTIKKDPSINKQELIDLVDMALMLHQALPESGYASLRALKRLAFYQASSRPFHMVTFLKNIRKKLAGQDSVMSYTLPGKMVRDIGLPTFSHKAVRE